MIKGLSVRERLCSPARWARGQSGGGCRRRARLARRQADRRREHRGRAGAGPDCFRRGARDRRQRPQGGARREAMARRATGCAAISTAQPTADGGTALAYVLDVFDSARAPRATRRGLGVDQVRLEENPGKASTRRRSPGSPQRAWTRSRPSSLRGLLRRLPPGSRWTTLAHLVGRPGSRTSSYPGSAAALVLGSRLYASRRPG